MKEPRPVRDDQVDEINRGALRETPKVDADTSQDDPLDQELRECVDLIDRVRRRATGKLTKSEGAGQNDPDAPKSLGRFEIVKELGRGGSGIVFQALDPELRRHVALKVPRPEYFITNEVQTRFLREAQAAAALKHESIVPVYEAGQAGAICYIAAEFCDGDSLATWLRSNSLPPERVAAAWVHQLAEGVEHAHRQGVLHRDLKPANVMLVTRTAAGAALLGSDPSDNALTNLQPKLTDFGLAKLVDNDATATRTGALLGTPAYMAPEQAEGRLEEVDERTDVYGLGAVLYELLSGSAPFSGDSELATLVAVREQEPSMPSSSRQGLSPDLEAICLKCLEKNPSRRYHSAAALADDLERYLTHRQVLARRPTPFDRIRKWSLRHQAVVWTSMSAAVLIAIGLAIAALMLAQSRREALTQRATAERATLTAEGQTKRAEQALYATKMTLAAEAVDDGEPVRALDILREVEPQNGEDDLRGFEWYYLWNRLHPGIERVFRRPVQSAMAVDISPDGKLVLVGGSLPAPGGRIKGFTEVWDIESGQSIEFREIPKEGTAMCAAFSHDGRMIASGHSYTSNVRIRVLGEKDDLHVIPNDATNTRSVCWSPDDQWVAAGYEDGQIIIYDVKTGNRVAELPLQSLRVLGLAFSPDGKQLYASNIADRQEESLLRIYDVTSPELRLLHEEPRAAINDVSPNGEQILGGYHSTSPTRVWDVSRRKAIHKINYDQTLSAAFTSHPNRIVTGGSDRLAMVWDLVSKRPILKLPHRNKVESTDVHIGRERWVSLDSDGVAKLWGPSHFQSSLSEAKAGFARRFDSFDSYAFSQGTDELFISEDSRSKVYNVGDDTLAELSIPGEVVAADATGKRLVILSADSTDEEVHFTIIDRQGNDDSLSVLLPAEENQRILQVELSANGRWLVARIVRGVMDKTPPWIVDLSQRPLKPVPMHDGRWGQQRIVFSPTSNHLAYAEQFGHVTLWDLQLLSCVEHLHGFWHASTWATQVAFSSDGKLLAAGFDNGAVKVWEMQSRPSNVALANVAVPHTTSVTDRRPIWEFTGQNSTVKSLTFFPDGKTLAIGSNESVRLLDMNSGLERASLPVSLFSRKIFVTSDGQKIISAQDNEIRVWDGSRRP